MSSSRSKEYKNHMVELTLFKLKLLPQNIYSVYSVVQVFNSNYWLLPMYGEI